VAEIGSSTGEARHQYVVMAARAHRQRGALRAVRLWRAEPARRRAGDALRSIASTIARRAYRRALVIGISQSGQSPDIVSVLQSQPAGRADRGRDQQASIAPAAAADRVIELHAGRAQHRGDQDLHHATGRAGPALVEPEWDAAQAPCAGRLAGGHRKALQSEPEAGLPPGWPQAATGAWSWDADSTMPPRSRWRSR
jgi:hypothetical protein